MLLIWLASFILAGIIISPFFWLRFLKKKSVGKYLVASSVVPLLFFWISLTWLYDFILKFVNSYNVLYYFDRISMNFIYIILIFIVLSPFIFTKIIKNKFTLKSFFLSLILSIIIFVSIFLYWAFVLLPQAFSQLHNYF
jgi:hypothetical protein